jgi:hypothetical protein
MSKRKMNDLNDIIATAYVTADYSNYNESYDNVRAHDSIKGNRSFGQHYVNLQEPSKSGSFTNNSFRNDTGGNIFLKNSQNNSSSFTSSSNPYSASNEKLESNKVVLNDDNFPSLGSTTSKINKPNTVLDFKKVVEKKPETVNKPEPKVSNTQHKKFSCNHQYSLYQEIKEKSEKIAHLKMVDDVSSDDNIDDGYY